MEDIKGVVSKRTLCEKESVEFDGEDGRSSEKKAKISKFIAEISPKLAWIELPSLNTPPIEHTK